MARCAKVIGKHNHQGRVAIEQLTSPPYPRNWAAVLFYGPSDSTVDHSQQYFSAAPVLAASDPGPHMQQHTLTESLDRLFADTGLVAEGLSDDFDDRELLAGR